MMSEFNEESRDTIAERGRHPMFR